MALMSSPFDALRSTRSSQWPAAVFCAVVLLRMVFQTLSAQLVALALLQVSVVAVEPSGRSNV